MSTLAPEEEEVAALEEWDVPVAEALVAAEAAVVAVAVAIANLAAVDPGIFALK